MQLKQGFYFTKSVNVSILNKQNCVCDIITDSRYDAEFLLKFLLITGKLTFRLSFWCAWVRLNYLSRTCVGHRISPKSYLRPNLSQNISVFYVTSPSWLRCANIHRYCCYCCFVSVMVPLALQLREVRDVLWPPVLLLCMLLIGYWTSCSCCFCCNL